MYDSMELLQQIITYSSVYTNALILLLHIYYKLTDCNI